MLLHFVDPIFLLAVLFVITVVWQYLRQQRKRRQSVPFPSTAGMAGIRTGSFKVPLRHSMFVATVTSLVFLVIVLARPQSVSRGQEVETEGIDIILALDISASMRARDFTPDRAGAAKQVASHFISSRPNDRIGIVLFAKQAFTQCALTIDHAVLQELLDGVEIGLVDPDNTAIGQALGVGLNRLKSSAAKSKVIILLTDGENNYGQPPTTLAEAAKALGVRVYTIGVGTRGTAPYPVRDPFGRTVFQRVQVTIDEDLLRSVADATGGKYFRATDNEKLNRIFAEIDRMEKTRTEVRAFRRYSELYYNWALAGLVLLVLSLVLSTTMLRSLV